MNEMNTLSLKLQILALLTEMKNINADELKPVADGLFNWCMQEAKVAETTNLKLV